MNKVSYISPGFGILRTSLLPYENLEHITNSKSKREFYRRMKQLSLEPIVSSAIFLSSPSLFERVKNWDPEDESKKAIKVRSALYRYLSRACTRSTPFGLFAGISRITTNKSNNNLNIKDTGFWKAHFEIDIEILAATLYSITLETDFWMSTELELNSTINSIGNSLRYREINYENLNLSNKKTSKLSEIEIDEAINFVVSELKGGIKGSKLIELLCKEFKVDESSSTDYIKNLLLEQVIVLKSVQITGNSPSREIINRFPSLNHNELDKIKKFHSLLDCDQNLKLDQEKNLFSKINNLSSLFEHNKSPLNVILNKSSDISLSSEVTREIENVTNLMFDLSYGYVDELNEFKEEFNKNFEGLNVRLLDVFDPISGLNWEKPNKTIPKLLSDLPKNISPTEVGHVFKSSSLKLLRLIANSLAKEQKVLNFTEKDINSLKSKRNQGVMLPQSVHVMFSYCLDDDGNNEYWIQNVSNSSGVSLLSRFGVADEELRNDLKEFRKAEELLNKDYILAEIIHLPEDRLGNVIVRPYLEGYEIPLMAHGKAKRDMTIGLDDLYVSIENDRVILTSKRLNKRIRPLISNAHNYSNVGNINIYKFLCLLETQGYESGGPFQSQAMTNLLPFIPRIKYKNIVLSAATWSFDSSDIKLLKSQPSEYRFKVLNKLRKEKNMPDVVLLKVFDNNLHIDFDSEESINCCWEHIVANPYATFCEPLPLKDFGAIKQSEKRVSHEFILPMTLSQGYSAINTQTQTRFDRVDYKEKSSLSLTSGGDFFYIKIYGDPTVLENILINKIAPLLMGAKNSSKIKYWFFIRYNDPEDHLRLRLFLSNKREGFKLIKDIHKILKNEYELANVKNIKTDTYQREIARYGGIEGTKLSEKIFYLDSCRTSELLEFQNLKPSESRFIIALLLADKILSAISNIDKYNLCELASNSYQSEYKVDKYGRKYLGSIYKDYSWVFSNKRNMIEKFEGWTNLTNTLNSYEEQEKKLFKKVNILLKDANINNKNHYAISLIHMMINRLMIDSPRNFDLLVFETLRRHYLSKKYK